MRYTHMECASAIAIARDAVWEARSSVSLHGWLVRQQQLTGRTVCHSTWWAQLSCVCGGRLSSRVSALLDGATGALRAADVVEAVPLVAFLSPGAVAAGTDIQCAVLCVY